MTDDTNTSANTPAPQDASRINSGGVAVRHDAGRVTRISVGEHTRTGANSASIMNTLTDKTGAPVIGRQANDTDRVRVKGIELSVAQAKAMGWLVERDGIVGDYEGKSPDAQREERVAAEREAAEKAADEAAMECSDETLQGLTAITEGCRFAGISPTFAMGQIVEGNIDLLVNDLAQTHGRDRADAIREYVAQVGQAFEADLASDLSRSVGLNDLPAAWAWLRENRASKIGAAINDLVFRGVAEPFRSLAREYIAATRSSDKTKVRAKVGARDMVTTVGTLAMMARGGSGLRVG